MVLESQPPTKSSAYYFDHKNLTLSCRFCGRVDFSKTVQLIDSLRWSCLPAPMSSTKLLTQTRSSVFLLFLASRSVPGMMKGLSNGFLSTILEISLRPSVDLAKYLQNLLFRDRVYTSTATICVSARIERCIYQLPEVIQSIELDWTAQALYRGTSLIRKRLPLGPYSSHIPRGLGWS